MNLEPDLICFSHHRWNFVFQRPNHLMSQCSNERRVFFVEQPIIDQKPKLATREVTPNLYVITPHLTADQNPIDAQRKAVMEACELYDVEAPIHWYNTPMAIEFARDLPSSLIVYDCMDELSAVHGAPPRLDLLERELFARADLVFAGGRSLYEAKQPLNPNVHLFPSSVDASHFGKARAKSGDGPVSEPDDQARIPSPRLGFFGVIDERLDLELIEYIAQSRPAWQIVMVGPVVNIDPASLPRRANIHYLGQKHYEQLPSYLAGWQVALMPFALNEATRFINPTKTLEYLAGGVPVVSAPIADVISPYAERGFVRVGSDERSFLRAIEHTLSEGGLGDRLNDIDAFIAGTSWADTWARMSKLMEESLALETVVESKVA
jgi:glycosyltransferase involved in cell wall biosynthesis